MNLIVDNLLKPFTMAELVPELSHLYLRKTLCVAKVVIYWLSCAKDN